MSWASRQNLLVRVVNRTFDAVPVIWGSIEGEGLLRKNSTIVQNGEMVIVDAMLENMPSALFGSIRHGQTITAAGQLWRVDYDAMRMGDGDFCRIPLTGPITPALPTFRVLTTTLGVPLTTTLGAPLTTLPLPANA